jgi:hypothetical protein
MSTPISGFCKFLHQGHERLVAAQRRGGLAHQLHAEKQHAQPHGHRAEVAQPRPAGEGLGKEADGDQEQRRFGDLESDDLRGNGGADIGAEDDADGLLETHHTRGDKAHDQHRGNRRGLDDRGHGGAGEGGAEPVAGELCKNILYPLAGEDLSASVILCMP